MVETDDIVPALRTVHDPEIPVNVYDFGLVYDITVTDSTADVEMTLTSPTCPIAGKIIARAEEAIEGVDGVETGSVELVWDPPWSPERATEEGAMQLRSLGISVPGSNLGEDE